MPGPKEKGATQASAATPATATTAPDTTSEKTSDQIAEAAMNAGGEKITLLPPNTYAFLQQVIKHPTKDAKDDEGKPLIAADGKPFGEDTYVIPADIGSIAFSGKPSGNSMAQDAKKRLMSDKFGVFEEVQKGGPRERAIVRLKMPLDKIALNPKPRGRKAGSKVAPRVAGSSNGVGRGPGRPRKDAAMAAGGATSAMHTAATTLAGGAFSVSQISDMLKQENIKAFVADIEALRAKHPVLSKLILS